MPMPSVEDLQTMYGAWNPQAYLQAQDNAGLERSFREQQYNQETEKAKQEQLSTLFQQQNDPLKLEQSRLTNQNLGYTGTGLQQDNDKKARDNRIAAANETYQIDANKAETLAKLSKAQLEQGESTAKRMMMSLDPVEQEKGKKLYGLTAHARDLADARTHAMELERYKQLQETGRATERNNSAERIAAAGVEGRKAVAAAKNTPTDFWTTFNNKLKTSRDKHAALIAEATRIGQENPEAAKVMLAMAESIRPQAEAEIASARPGTPDTSGLTGIPANKGPNINPNAPKRGAGTASDPIVLK